MTQTAENYLNLVTSEHAKSIKFIAFLTANLKGLVELQNVVASFPENFDIDNAEGAQLDVIGRWVGVSRYLKSAITTDDGPVSVLPDETFKFLVKAQIAANAWNGSVPNAYEVWGVAFGGDSRIIIQDNQNMSMSVLIFIDSIPSLTQELINQGFLNLKPEGVKAVYLVAPLSGKIFAWDKEEDEFFGGWGIGYWAAPA